MKKGIIAIVLVLVLLAAMLGGTVLTASAAGPATLSVIANTAPGPITVSGTGWTTPATKVNLYIDTVDEAHHVAIATPNGMGNFVIVFTVGATTVGDHTMIAKQNGTTVNKTFTLTSVTQVDDRIYNAVDKIEKMLEDPVYGLAEIKREVSDIGNTTDEISTDVDHIESMLESRHDGLPAINRALDQIKDNMAMVACDWGQGDAWYYGEEGDYPTDTHNFTYQSYCWHYSYPQIRHVSLTIAVGPGDIPLDDGGLHGVGNVTLSVWMGAPGGPDNENNEPVGTDKENIGELVPFLPLYVNSQYCMNPYVLHFDFDTSYWRIDIYATDGDVHCTWNVVTTTGDQVWNYHGGPA